MKNLKKKKKMMQEMHCCPRIPLPFVITLQALKQFKTNNNNKKKKIRTFSNHIHCAQMRQKVLLHHDRFWWLPAASNKKIWSGMKYYEPYCFSENHDLLTPVQWGTDGCTAQVAFFMPKSITMTQCWSLLM